MERVPVVGSFRGFMVIGMGPPSSGGILIKQMLGMLETFDLKELGHNSSRYIQLLTEVEKLAFADRARHLGDSDFYSVPIGEITSPEYIALRSRLINPLQATPSSEISHGPAPKPESEETTHFSVIDRWGSAVSCTTTLNSGFGSLAVAAGTGVMLNNEMDDFSTKPGFPNIYGLIGGKANAIEPGKRMLSSMSPTIVTKDGSIVLVVGTPGGSTIITSVLQVLLNVLVHEMGVQQAVAAPRFHHQWLPDKTSMESNRFPKDVLDKLESMKHTLSFRSTIGDVHAIFVDIAGGIYFGCSDPRRGGMAAGY